MNLRIALSRVLLIAICFIPAIASADDFAPPPWLRSDPFAVTAEWEFSTPANPTPPDGLLTNVLLKGSDTAPGGTSAAIVGDAGLGWGIGTGDGGWFFPDGGSIRFRMDNVVDQRPIKHLRMQVTHTPGISLALDALPGFNFLSTGSIPGPATIIPHGPVGGPPLHVGTVISWDMFPNPPWEDFMLLISGAGEIDQIVVDTISIPEPAAIMMCAIAMLSGSAFRRRRN